MTKEDKIKKKNIRFGILVGALALFGIGYGTYKYIHSQSHEETEDAQLKSNVTGVIPRVSGYIKEVRVVDNQMVHKGDTLIVLDDVDYRIHLKEEAAGIDIAESNVALAEAGGVTAQSSVAVSQSQVMGATANIETAKVNLWRAKNDFDRYQKLFDEHAITKQQFEQAQAAYESANAQFKAYQAQQDGAKHQATVTKNQSLSTSKQVAVAQANLERAKAAYEVAFTNLGYTTIVAPVDGRISRVNLLPGQYVLPGQTLANIVGQDIWVIGNFKETQLNNMRQGQSVEITIDAYPGKTWEGEIASLSPATGSEFALLPPDNASGNFVKVVQRIPVKITFKDTSKESLELLRAGLNAVVDVHTK